MSVSLYLHFVVTNFHRQGVSTSPLTLVHPLSKPSPRLLIPAYLGHLAAQDCSLEFHLGFNMGANKGVKGTSGARNLFGNFCFEIVYFGAKVTNAVHHHCFFWGEGVTVNRLS